MSTKKASPNVLWICTDQQRFDSLGCYGNTYVDTPNIDKLASKGILFENAYCQNPVCTPSRSSFLTGRYPRTTCCRQNGQNIPDREVLISKRLKDEGYAVGLSGKLHISAAEASKINGTEKRIDDGYDVFYWSHGRPHKSFANQYHIWLRENGLEYSTTKIPETEYVEMGMPEEHHQTKWCIDKAIDFIDHCESKEKPWFFSVNIFDPHVPFNPPPEFFEKYRKNIDAVPLPNYVEGELDKKPQCQQAEHRESTHTGSSRPYPFVKMNDTDKRFITAAYWAMVENIDKQVGRIYDFLGTKGCLENTIIIFMSDHGELLGDHGMYCKGPFFYEPCVKVPLIVSWPDKIEPGKRSKALIELLDLTPTLLEILDLDIPPAIQGLSLWPLISGRSAVDEHKKSIYCEYYNSIFWKKPGVYATMIRDERYKVVSYHSEDSGELYDLTTDPRETWNLWDDPDSLAVKSGMLKKLSDCMAWTMDPLPYRVAAF